MKHIRLSPPVWKLIAGILVAVGLVGATPLLALNIAVPYVQADYLWDQGYTGSGAEIGIIDLLLADGSHPAIDGNYLGFEKFSKGASSLGSHATEVAGTAVSQDPTYRGAAPGAGWWTGQTTNPGGLSSQRIQTVAAETFAQGLDKLAGNPVEVITMSIGLSGTTNGMDQWSLGLDHIVHTNGRTITVAAGNNGPASNSLDGLPSAAFNVITSGPPGPMRTVVPRKTTAIWPATAAVAQPTTDAASRTLSPPAR